MPRRRRWAAAAVILLAACRVPSPVPYQIPPGISASLPPSQLKLADQFAKTFCSVLAERSFATEGWGPCSTYLRMDAVPPASTPGPLPTEWTLLLVGGFGSECLAPDVVTFQDAGAHLQSEHGIGSHSIPVAAFATTEENAVTIRDFVAKRPEKRFIAITHSKGAADFMVALARYPAELERVEALITVAGAIGGSWLVDDFNDLNEKLLRKLRFPQCRPPAGDRDNGIDSMRRQVRQEFLARTEPMWRAYSITAVSDRQNTSAALKGLWDRIAPYSLDQDSHIVERESIVPGGRFLGRALGDHWAVAMPFHNNPKVTADALKFVDRNRFPRAALIEAAVRVVTEDLAVKR